MAVPNMIVTLAMNATKYSQGLKKAAGQSMSFGQLTTKAFNLAKGAMLALALGLARIIPDLANMGAESRKADVQLKFMLENLQGIGPATDKTVKAMARYADQVNKATGIDDEQVKAVQKKLLIFDSLRKTAGDLGGTFERTTGAAIDLAAAGFGDMESNALKLGKALENPTQKLGQLERAGITFTEAEKAKIAALQQSGDLLGAQEIVLGKVEERVLGIAEASATPFEKMAGQFAQMGDTIGEAMLPALEEMNLQISAWLSSDQGKKDLQNIVDAFVAIAQAVNLVVGGVIALMDAWAGATGQLDAYAKSQEGLTGSAGSRFYVPGVTPTASTPTRNTSSAPVINFNVPVDSVSAGREVSRALEAYNRANGMR